MRVNVRKPAFAPKSIHTIHIYIYIYIMLTKLQDPEIQKVTGKSNPVDVMAALREMKNSM